MELQNLPTLTTIQETDAEGTFSVEPLAPGYGSTLGNALRRVLLSSLEGAAVDDVRIEGVEHEFSTIANVREDVIQIILNLKLLRFRLETEQAELNLEAHGPATVTAAQFGANADCTVLNPEQPIATLDKDGHLSLRISVKRGVGYEPVEKKAERERSVGVITIDSVYSPVRAVAYTVENTRVGQMTNFDRLLLEVKTDGSVAPATAVMTAARILSSHYLAIAGDQINTESSQADLPEGDDYSSSEERLTVTDDAIEILQMLDPKTKIEEAGLSGRTAHALLAAGYKTLAGLKRLSDIKLQSIKGLGTKGVDEVKAVLSRVS